MGLGEPFLLRCYVNEEVNIIITINDDNKYLILHVIHDVMKEINKFKTKHGY